MKNRKWHIKAGSGSFLFGVLVVLLLIAGNIMWALQGENLYNTGERFLPPFNPTLQELLFVPDHVEQYSETASDGGFFGSFFDDDTEEDEDQEAEDFFLNSPSPVAVSGSLYSYTPELLIPDVQLYMEDAPEGFEYAEGRFEWTPEPEQAGSTYTIILGAAETDGKTHFLEYDLHVSEHRYLMGTNNRGRSVFGLLIEGTYWATVPGLIAVGVAMFFGVLLGAISGYGSGPVPKSIDYSVQILESMPALLLFVLAAVIFRFNIFWVMVAVGIAFAPIYIKMVRAMVKKFVQNQFVEASKELGFRNSVVLWRDIIWVNGKASLAAQTCYCFAFAILAEVTLSYLQIGVRLSDGVSWGAMLYENRAIHLSHRYWLLFFPAMAVIISIIGFYLLGDGLAKLLDYKEED